MYCLKTLGWDNFVQVRKKKKKKKKQKENKATYFQINYFVTFV